jgi:hypothetical protein
MADVAATPPLQPGRIAVSVEAEPTPLVTALAADLGACLADGSFAADTAGLAGAISIRDAETPQAATLTIGEGRVAIVHGADPEADLTAAVRLPLGSGPPGEFEPGEDTPAELARWLESLLTPPLPDWPDAAEAFWSALESMPGSPPALLVVDETGQSLRFGAQQGDAYEIHGSTAALVRLLTGRVPLLDAAHGGEVAIRGSFPAISVLTGAGFRVRYGSIGD